MKRWILTSLYLGAGVALMLAAVGVVLYATLRIPSAGPFRPLLIAADVLVGVSALVGSVYLAVQLGVRLFAEDAIPSNPDAPLPRT